MPFKFINHDKRYHLQNSTVFAQSCVLTLRIAKISIANRYMRRIKISGQWAIEFAYRYIVAGVNVGKMINFTATAISCFHICFHRWKPAKSNNSEIYKKIKFHLSNVYLITEPMPYVCALILLQETSVICSTHDRPVLDI